MKKLLLVSVSVGVFLLITITVALIVLTPKTLNQETVFSSSAPISQTRPIQYIDNPLDQLAVNPPIAIINENGERPEAVIASDRSHGNNVTLHVPIPDSTAIPESTHTPAVTKTSSAPSTPTAAARAVPAPSQTPAASQSAAQQKPKSAALGTASTSASRTTAPAKTINDFWIQTGAYPSMVGAEDIRETLANNGLVGIVSIFEDNRTWYRVRLGPYTSEKEANHWLAIVKSINGFDKSEVRQTVRQQ